MTPGIVSAQRAIGDFSRRFRVRPIHSANHQTIKDCLQATLPLELPMKDLSYPVVEIDWQYPMLILIAVLIAIMGLA